MKRQHLKTDFRVCFIIGFEDNAEQYRQALVKAQRQYRDATCSSIPSTRDEEMVIWALVEFSDQEMAGVADKLRGPGEGPKSAGHESRCEGAYWGQMSG